MTPRKALIVGATGLIGGHCLQTLLDDPAYSQVTVLVRKPLLVKHRKLKEIITSFNGTLEKTLFSIFAHDIFCCLGSTIKKAGSQKAFRKVDFSLVVAIARIMRRQGAEQFIVISAMSADSNSIIFYNRTKGEMENALRRLGYPCLRVIRPSLLLGHRKEFRLGERIGILTSAVWKHLLVGSLKNYRPVEAKAVARFMVKVAHEEQVLGMHVYDNCFKEISGESSLKCHLCNKEILHGFTDCVYCNPKLLKILFDQIDNSGEISSKNQCIGCIEAVKTTGRKWSVFEYWNLYFFSDKVVGLQCHVGRFGFVGPVIGIRTFGVINVACGISILFDKSKGEAVCKIISTAIKSKEIHITDKKLLFTIVESPLVDIELPEPSNLFLNNIWLKYMIKVGGKEFHFESSKYDQIVDLLNRRRE